MNATREEWTDKTPSLLRGSCAGDESIIAQQVRDGVSHLYHITGESVDLWTVTRGESVGDKKQLVILCVGGKGMDKAGPFLIDQARKNGFDSIRYHTKKLAIHRLYSGLGFGGVEVERVYEVALGGDHG